MFGNEFARGYAHPSLAYCLSRILQKQSRTVNVQAKQALWASPNKSSGFGRFWSFALCWRILSCCNFQADSKKSLRLSIEFCLASNKCFQPEVPWRSKKHCLLRSSPLSKLSKPCKPKLIARRALTIRTDHLPSVCWSPQRIWSRWLRCAAREARPSWFAIRPKEIKYSKDSEPT